MASERPKKENMYVYNINPTLPRSTSMKAAISKGWGSLMKSKTYKERSDKEKVAAGKGGEAAEERKPERKSVSAVEGNGGAAAAAFLQVKVLASDMPGEMRVHAFRCARSSFERLDKFSSKYMAYN